MRAMFFPDNVNGLEVSLPIVPSKVNDRTVVGIAPMPYPFCDPREHQAGHQAIYDTLIAKMATFSLSLSEHHCDMALFGSDTGADPASIEDLRIVLRDCHNILTPQYEPVEYLYELLSRMAKMDYVVTCRFHGVVFAHLLNKPVLAISHHPKVANLMNALGLSKYCVDIATFDPTQLTALFESLVSHTDEIKSTLAASLTNYRSQLAIQFDELFPPDTSESGCCP